jgi:hypothetical protein
MHGLSVMTQTLDVQLAHTYARQRETNTALFYMFVSKTHTLCERLRRSRQGGLHAQFVDRVRRRKLVDAQCKPIAVEPGSECQGA